MRKTIETTEKRAIDQTEKKADQSAQSRLISRPSTSKDGQSKRIRSPEKKTSEEEKVPKKTKITIKDSIEEEKEASKQRLALLKSEAERLQNALADEKKKKALLDKKAKEQEKMEQQEKIFYRKHSEKIYGVTGNIKLSLHWKYGQLSTINLDRIDSAKIRITWTKEGQKELDKMLANNPCISMEPGTKPQTTMFCPALGQIDHSAP